MSAAAAVAPSGATLRRSYDGDAGYIALYFGDSARLLIAWRPLVIPRYWQSLDRPLASHEPRKPPAALATPTTHPLSLMSCEELNDPPLRRPSRVIVPPLSQTTASDAPLASVTSPATWPTLLMATAMLPVVSPGMGKYESSP
jgi:hypothetical protein